MGVEVDREQFNAEDYEAFSEQLERELDQLREVLARPGFGEGDASIGAEVEMHLADAAGRPACVNGAVLEALDDPRCTLETDAFNLEVNASPQPLAGKPFSALREDLAGLLSRAQRAAAGQEARIVLAGTLPTLTMAQLQAGVMSDSRRYRAMSRTLRELRGEPFFVRIDGREPLRVQCEDLSLEGSNASLQVHLRTTLRDFPATYNAAQLAAAPLLAVTGNSPYFDHKCLWEETRIALFKHSVDTRVDEERTRAPARVTFGHGYLHDAYTAFAENVSMHQPLLPIITEPTSRDGVPELNALRLHHGTVWTWNRAVFDPDAGGHLRVEHRVVASGPTLIDMLANAAFTVGLTLALAPRMAAWMPALPFVFAERNMYRAAKHGLQAELAWPSQRAPSPRPVNARQLVLDLLPLTEAALIQHGVDAEEARELLSIIRGRAESGQTGAMVQQTLVAKYETQGLSRANALAEMLESYLAFAESDQPVHRWQL